MSGSVLSVNVADVRELRRGQQTEKTGIWKLPVDGPVDVRGVNVDGDEQGDRTVHGGVHKAVYAYAREDTNWWEKRLEVELPHGVFGENLTLRGTDVSGALIGERWQIGSVLLEVSEPRFPCWKLGVRFGNQKIVKAFAAALRPGAYLRIVEEGRLQAGDPLVVASRPDHDLTIRAFAQAYLADRSQLPRLLIPDVSEAWRDWVRERAA
jgi:MOSC domain-containing protein YiiM